MNQQDRRGTERAISTRPIDVAPGDTATISRRAMLALSGAGAVSNGGGIGVPGNAIEPPLGTRALIQATKALTPNLFGVDFLFDESAFASVTSGPK